MSFADNFWGEKNNGFFVLHSNMKHGQTSVKDLGDCLRETLTVEEQYSKLLNKLTRNIANASAVGTFSPFWAVWKAFIEKLSSLHMQMMHTCSDLMKDIMRYSEEQHKKHKQVKETEQPTLEAVQGIQTTLTAVHKAKEIYHTRCIERERLRRENASAKELEKAELKYKKAYDEYKALVEKYQTVKTTFEKKMTESCRHYQELEEEHICQMKDFVDTYIKAWENQHALLGQVQHEFKSNCDDLTVQKLINTFIEAKSTGKEKPGPIEFVEPDLSSLPSPSTRPMSPEPGAADKRDSFTERQKQEPATTTAAVAAVASSTISLSDSSGSPSPVLSDQPGPLSRSVKLRVSRTWFLKNRTKKKEKKSKKKKEKDAESLDNESQGDGPEAAKAEDAPRVDEDGFCIRPENPMDNNGDKNSWYSSDSDSDSDAEERRQKIKVAIRPLSPTNVDPTTNNVDAIRASVQGLSLSPTAVRKRAHTPIDKKMKRSQSESDTLDKPNQDLLNLDFFASSSSASTPTGASYSLPSPLNPQTEINWSLTSAPVLSQPASSPNKMMDLFNTSNGSNTEDRAHPTPTLFSQVTSPTTAGAALPGPATPARPLSRNKVSIPPPIPQPVKLQNGPIPLSRSESSGPAFSTTSMPIGSSRGPSPLTIGMSDTIPLAVAFTDTVSAFFKGTDATKCTVRLSGLLHMSFPIGIIKVFTDNPNPPTLTFKLKNVSRLENIDHCNLVAKDESQSAAESTVYVFDMNALKDHLRKQGEQNRTAYYNVEILRYQVKARPGVESTPLPLVVYWKCEENSCEWRLDYRYNASAMSSPATVKNVTVVVSMPPDAEVAKMLSHPLSGKWDPETKRATWKLNDISEVSEQESQGFIRAKFDLKSGGPIKPNTTMLQFGAEGANLSGSDFELVGSGYRISLTKKRFCTGKYYADPEPSVSHV